MNDPGARAREVRERMERPGAEPDPDELHALLSTDDPDAVRTAADALRSMADRDPDPLLDAVDRLVDLLEHPDEEVRNAATAAIAGAATHDAGPVSARLPAVAERLEDEYDLVRWNAVKVFHAVALTDRASVVPYVDDVAPFLRSSEGDAHRNAAFCLGNVAVDHPEAVADAVPGLLSVFREGHETLDRVEDAPIQMKRDVQRQPDERFEDERKGTRNARLAAGHALFEVARTAPAAVAGHLDEIRAVLRDDDPFVRETAADVVFGLASADPEAAVACIGPLGDRLTGEEAPIVHESATQALNAISLAAPDEIGAVAVERAGVIRDLLSADDPAVRGAAASLLDLAAGRDSAVVEPAAERLADLESSDDAKYVREAAAAALERL